MQNKLRGLITTFVLITTVSIPQITLASERQPQTSQQLSKETLVLLENNRLNDDQRQKIKENRLNDDQKREIKEKRLNDDQRQRIEYMVQASEHKFCHDLQIQRLSGKDDFCPDVLQVVSNVQTSPHPKGNIISMIESAVRIIELTDGKKVLSSFTHTLKTIPVNEILNSVEKEIPAVIQTQAPVMGKQILKAMQTQAPVIEKQILKAIR